MTRAPSPPVLIAEGSQGLLCQPLQCSRGALEQGQVFLPRQALISPMQSLAALFIHFFFPLHSFFKP